MLKLWGTTLVRLSQRPSLRTLQNLKPLTSQFSTCRIFLAGENQTTVPPFLIDESLTKVNGEAFSEKTAGKIQQNVSTLLENEDLSSIQDREPPVPRESIEKFRRDNRITIVDSSVPVPDPIFDFADLDLPHRLKIRLTGKGFKQPMPIQAQGWPIALAGHDMIGIGETGSGKTLGFLLPAFDHIIKNSESTANGPRVLVLAPTRELAQQTEVVAREFGRECGIHTVSVFGGASRQAQMNRLRFNPQIVVATPGRLLDVLECGGTTLESCTYVVLDEADRMLDMGFEDQIRDILSQLGSKRQLLMWSATWPKDVRNLANDFFSKYKNDIVHMNIGSPDLQANPNIEQVIEVTDTSLGKNDKLMDLLKNFDETEKVLIFAATKRQVDVLERLLRRKGLFADGIHGDKTQAMRDRSLDRFRRGRSNILVATDVASRGLDVDDIKLVINYDFPNNIEDYIHRIGRTGRRGRSGKSYSIIVESEATISLVNDLINVLNEAGQEVSKDLIRLSRTASAKVVQKRKKTHSNSWRRNSFNDDFSSYRRRDSFRFGENRSYTRSKETNFRGFDD